MSIQTTVSSNPGLAYAGMLVDPDKARVITRINGSGGALDFGIGVIEGTTRDNEFDTASGTGFSLLGIIVHEHLTTNRDLTGTNGVADNQPCKIMTSGMIWVLPEEAVTQSSDVYMRHTVNSTLTTGHFRTDADTSKADQISNAKWLTAGSSTVPALLLLNNP